MAKFVLVSTKQLLDLVRRFNRGGLGRSGRDVAVSKVLKTLPDKLKASAESYRKVKGEVIPAGRSAVPSDFFDALKESVARKKRLEGSVPKRKGTRPAWPDTHVYKDSSTGKWVALDHVGEEMGRDFRSKRSARGEVKNLAAWLDRSRDPRAVRERGARYDPGGKDPLSALIKKSQEGSNTGNN